MPEIPQALTDAVETFGKDIFDKAAQTSVGKKIGTVFDQTSHFRNMQSGMSATPAGANLYKILKEDYEPAVDKARQGLVKAQQGAAQPLKAHEIEAQARNIGRVSAFGRNDALAVQHIKWANQTHGLAAAQSLADHLHVYLGDTVEREIGKNPMRPISSTNPVVKKLSVSRFKENVSFNKENRVPINTTAIYKPKTPLEESLVNKAVTTMAPAIAISHLSTPFNTMLGAPLTSLAKGLADVITPGGYRATRDALLDSGVLAQTALQMYREHEVFESGRIANWTGSPQLGYILNKAIHAPGFNALRRWTIAFSGATATHSADYFAQRLVANPADRLSQRALREMGIAPSEVLAQGGKLRPEQIEKAVYRFVDDRVFLNTKLDRSYAGISNPYMRMATLFHSYVSAQGHLISRELGKMWKTGDIGNIVQTLSVLSVVFPAVGHLIGGTERLARGQSFKDPKYDSESAVAKYFDNVSHMAGFGVGQSYINGALRDRLASVMLGPVGNVAVSTVSDSVMALAGKKSFKQPARDIMYYSLPDNLGKILAHQVLPTTAEESAKKFHKLKLKPGFKKLKKGF